MLPSASLVPKDDSSVLFTTAGMQQFKKLYSNPENAKDPRVATVQPCLRTSDIEEIGDESHLTFFEMLGNFSFGFKEGMQESDSGPYFKEKAIEYAWEFLTEELKISKDRISATFFDWKKAKSGIAITLDDFGKDGEDIESRQVLEKLDGLRDIKAQGEDNFWTLGTVGSPGGPTVEFYVDGLEVWNLVFNEIIFKGSHWENLVYKGVDTGMGFERLVTVLNKAENVYHTDLFEKPHKKLHEFLKVESPVDERIILDHIKAATFIINENIEPSNKSQGYILRRLIRRSVVKARNLKIDHNFTAQIAVEIVKTYPDYELDSKKIEAALETEETKFRKTLSNGLELMSNMITEEDGKEIKSEIYGKEIFDLFQQEGIPAEVSVEVLKENGHCIDPEWETTFNALLKEHQELSRTASAGMFKGGLADAGEETTKLHTTAHLMLAALRQVLGYQIEQKGSNITAERLRFDFNNPEKLTDEQIKKVEEIVNKNIEEDLPVTVEEMSIEEAKNSGATGSFSDRYGEKVKVYTIGPSTSLQKAQGRSGSREEYFSREICGGPHVDQTGVLGHFKIIREESSSAGIRRIKAVLE